MLSHLDLASHTFLGLVGLAQTREKYHSIFTLRRRNWKYLTWYLHETGGGNCSPGSSRLYRLGVSQAQKVKVSGDVGKKCKKDS